MWEQLLISLLPGLFQMAVGNNTSFSKINLKDAFSNPQNLSNLIGLFGQGYQTALNYQNQQQNLEWQRNFAMQQFNYNSMLNDRSFFHSLPASQISKLISAGLSPDLAYGQLSGMDYGNTQSLQMPNSGAPNFAGLENANLLKDLSKKESDISLNLSKKAINEIDYSLKQIEELFANGTLQYRIEGEFLKNQYQKITNQLVESNVETNVINNMKLAASLGLVKSIDKDGNIKYNTTPKFNEIVNYYLSDLRQKYNLNDAEYKNALKKFEKLGVEISALNSEILINSVAYQQDILNLIVSAVGSGVNLSQDAEGNWVIDYSGDGGDVAGIVAMGLIDSVLSAVGIKFTLGKNASRVLGKHETKSIIKSENVNKNLNQNID